MRRQSFPTFGRLFISISLLSVLWTCASMRSSTETVLVKPPYYHGRSSGTGLRIAHFPIFLDRRMKDTEAMHSWKILLESMNAFIDSAGWSVPVEPIDPPIEEAPDVYFGSVNMPGAPVVSSQRTEDEASDPTQTILVTVSPSKTWMDKWSTVAKQERLDAILCITVGLGEYFILQTSLLGKKELGLGTGHRITVKWLTSLDDPVEVLHVTGVLLDKEGKRFRAGAEGILAAGTASFFESLIGFKHRLTPDDVEQIKAQRRNDLQDRPFQHHVALQNLVGSLIGRDDLIIK